MTKLLLAIALFLSLKLTAQNIPCGTTAISLKGVDFKSVCLSLLDSGYIIDKKDTELRTVSTAPRRLPSRYNATYTIYARFKDSLAIFSVTFNAPSDGSIVRNEPSIYKCKKNGKFIDNIFTYPFILLNQFVKGLGQVAYITK